MDEGFYDKYETKIKGEKIIMNREARWILSGLQVFAVIIIVLIITLLLVAIFPERIGVSKEPCCIHTCITDSTRAADIAHVDSMVIEAIRITGEARMDADYVYKSHEERLKFINEEILKNIKIHTGKEVSEKRKEEITAIFKIFLKILYEDK